MKEVKINGYTYYWDGSKLWLDPIGIVEVPMNHITKNEKEQLEMWVKYNGRPMLSFD